MLTKIAGPFSGGECHPYEDPNCDCGFDTNWEYWAVEPARRAASVQIASRTLRQGNVAVRTRMARSLLEAIPALSMDHITYRGSVWNFLLRFKKQHT
jgi:hypothetical protein